MALWVSWSDGPWAGAVVPTAPPNQVVVPPGTGGTASYTYGVQQATYPWAYGGWSGGVAPYLGLVGGIVVTPVVATGTVTISAWWPYAPAVQIMRTGPDGVRTAVRGAYPLTPGATLVNCSTNPDSVATTGYVAGTGTPTLSVVTRTDATGGTAIRATNASPGTSEVTVPQSLLAGPQVTVAVDLQFSARPSSVTFTLAWADSGGGALTASAVTLTGDQINASVGQWSRQVLAVTPPTGAATCPSLKLNAGGMPAAGTMDIDRWMLVRAATDGTYGDGSSLGGTWTGATGLSTSIVASVVVATDGECPFDVPVSYQVYAPILEGGWASSPSVTLASNGLSWITHPASPATPVQVSPTINPALTRTLARGVFGIIGKPNPLVVSSTTRSSPTGSLLLDTATFAARDALFALFADGSAILLRCPADHGYGQGMWLALGDIVEDPKGLPVWCQTRLITVPFDAVDPPAGPNTMVV